MNIVIIGGGATGASCATRLRRLNEHAKITILEKTNEISIANCGLPYYISEIIPNREDVLVSDIDTFQKWFQIEVHLNTCVSEIQRQNKVVITENGQIYPYDKLVLATGSSPFIPETPGFENEYVFPLKHLSDADRIKNYIDQHNVKKAIVVGGGFIGLEMVENLKEKGIQVSLIEAGSQILPPFDADIAQVAYQKLIHHQISVYLNTFIQKVEKNKAFLSSGEIVDADMIIVSIGVKPETKIAEQAGLKLGFKNALCVNSHLQTSDPDIYAGGDNIEVMHFTYNTPTSIPLAGPANRQGRIIADNISGLHSEYTASQGSSILKLFDTAFAISGANERGLKSSQASYKTIHTWSNSHAGYYPDATPLLTKLIFDANGTILGVQCYGANGADKVVDQIALLMRQKATISDLIESESCYAPPFNSAKTPINIIGMAAENVLNQFVIPCYDIDPDALLIDVRPPLAFQSGSLKGAINIPVFELRSRLEEIPKDKKIIVFCTKGYTGYIASRILKQSGFTNVWNLSGGMMFFQDKGQQ